MKPHLILTRPRAQCERFGASLREVLGETAEIVISPLLQIKPVEFDAVPSGRDVVFTSENGVAGFVAGANAQGRKAFCVGDRTAEAAREAGFEAFSASGTSRDLIDLVAAEGGGEMIYARGAHIARDLCADFAAIGIPVTELLVYTQDPLELSDAAKKAISGSERVIFPLFSTRSMELLVAQGIAGGAAHKSAVCISKGVADAAPDGCFDTVLISEAPNSRCVVEKMRALVA